MPLFSSKGSHLDILERLQVQYMSVNYKKMILGRILDFLLLIHSSTYTNYDFTRLSLLPSAQIKLSIRIRLSTSSTKMISNNQIATYNKLHGKPCPKCQIPGSHHTELEALHLDISQLEAMVMTLQSDIAKREREIDDHYSQFADERIALEKLIEQNELELKHLLCIIDVDRKARLEELPQLISAITKAEDQVNFWEVCVEGNSLKLKPGPEPPEWRAAQLPPPPSSSATELEKAKKELQELVLKKGLLESELETLQSTFEACKKDVADDLDVRRAAWRRKTEPHGHLSAAAIEGLKELEEEAGKLAKAEVEWYHEHLLGALEEREKRE